jgi:hypothetical protein
MIPLLIILTTVLLAPGETRLDQAHTPASTFSQSLQLHKGWNLVSWNIWPSGTVGVSQRFDVMLPENGWIGSNPGGRVYTYEDPDLYWPPNFGDDYWDPHWAYYFNMYGSHTWTYENKPRIASEDIDMTPDDAWSDDIPGPDGQRMRWFFLGYSTNGYQKLASIPNSNYVGLGNPAHFDYEGPFHWLIWHPDGPNQNKAWDLKIVRTDDDRVYIPRATSTPGESNPINQIEVLEPGRGYFLGFYCTANQTYTLEDGWPDSPGWINNSLEPGPMFTHFQFAPYTHWSYQVLIDTVDLFQTPLEIGDEIAVFDGAMCVGAVHYSGGFPLVLTAWKDDIATPGILDGYLAGHEMTFKWFDVSENTEAVFTMPPGTYELDDPVTPSHSGFGRGAYGVRSFASGSQVTLQLPKEFKLGQNYPNPFNAETIIPLELPQRSDIKIELFNVCGQNLGVIFNGVREGGWPKIHYNASGLASGMYFCRVTAKGLERGGKYQSVGKLLLLK